MGAVAELTVELENPDVYQSGIPQDVFAYLRSHAPVHWSPAAADGGFWSVTTYPLVDEVSRNHELFSSARRDGGFRLFDEADRHLLLPASILSADGTEHAAHRRLMAQALSAPTLARLKVGVKARARALVEAMLARRGPVDLVADFAAPLTMGTFLELIGARPEDGDMFHRWACALVGDEDPEYACDWEALAKEVAAFAFSLWTQRATAPQADLISAFGSPEGQNAGVGFFDFLATLLVLIVAGNETTRNSLVGGALALALNEDQLELAANDGSIIRSVVQEAVRWTSPINHMRRTALADTSIGGQAIAAGERVVIWYSSANFDETRFVAPLRFDARGFVSAAAPEHIGFGVGAHRCIGRRLAEMQLQIAFEELLSHVREIRLLRPPRRLRSNFINGFKSLEVSLAA